MKQALGTLPPLCFLLFGLVMIYGSVTMEASFSGTNEHRWFPLGMSILVSLLAAYLLGRQVLGLDAEEALYDPHGFVLLIIPCILHLAAYAQGSIWFGYPAATFVSGFLVFRLFQNGWVSSLVQSTVATLLLYTVFFKLLKLYNPPGTVLDLQLPF